MKIKAAIRLSAIHLLSIFLLQACVSYRHPQPVSYPPPRATAPPPPQAPLHEQQGSVSIPEPEREAPKEGGSIAEDFRRQAAKQVSQGKLGLASATLERGLRIAPKDAMLWSQLAEVKLQQRQYQQAWSLATKSNSLAGGYPDIVERNYWIMEESLRRAGDH